MESPQMQTRYGQRYAQTTSMRSCTSRISIGSVVAAFRFCASIQICFVLQSPLGFVPWFESASCRDPSTRSRKLRNPKRGKALGSGTHQCTCPAAPALRSSLGTHGPAHVRTPSLGLFRWLGCRLCFWPFLVHVNHNHKDKISVNLSLWQFAHSNLMCYWITYGFKVFDADIIIRQKDAGKQQAAVLKWVLQSRRKIATKKNMGNSNNQTDAVKEKRIAAAEKKRRRNRRKTHQQQKKESKSNTERKNPKFWWGKITGK